MNSGDQPAIGTRLGQGRARTGEGVAPVYRANEGRVLMEWIFDGVGTAIVAGLIGAASAGSIYAIRHHKKVSIRQRQTARKNSEQMQAGRDIRIDQR